MKWHPWPLCYIVGAQSDTAESLKTAWKASCELSADRVIPQFIISLDTGFLYGGHRKWPCPRYPGNYTNAEDVVSETGICAGLGLAWFLTQQQGRLAIMQNQSVGKIQRFSRLLDETMMKPSLPATFSYRFETMFRMRPIAGKVEWGSTSRWVHNFLQLCSLTRRKGEVNATEASELIIAGKDPKSLNWKDKIKYLRWFKYQSNVISGRFLALEEWIDYSSKANHTTRVAVFDTVTGEEIVNDLVKELSTPSDIESAAPKISSLK